MLNQNKKRATQIVSLIRLLLPLVLHLVFVSEVKSGRSVGIVCHVRILRMSLTVVEVEQRAKFLQVPPSFPPSLVALQTRLTQSWYMYFMPPSCGMTFSRGCSSYPRL